MSKPKADVEHIFKELGTAGAATLPFPIQWRSPERLPSGLKTVSPLDYQDLPATIAPFVRDIAERMQCPPDYPAAAAYTFLGSILGRRVGIRPQDKTDWMEVPNIWGAVVGRPGGMKSPAIGQVENPIKWLEGEARKSNEEELKKHEREVKLHEFKKKHLEKQAEIAIKENNEYSGELCMEAPKAPARKRYLVNDSTYESLGVILADNPNGVCVSRDELIPLLQILEENPASLALYLTAWNGTSGFDFDRVIRGHVHIPAACISVFGCTTPGKLAEHVRSAVKGGARDSGLIQRFALMVWPDQTPVWKNIDRYPDGEAKQKAWDAFKHLDKLDPFAVGAEVDNFGNIPFLRFNEAAQYRFDEWRAALELRLRSGELHAAMESHFSKYRKLVPALALINHLADGGTGPVGEAAAMKAIAFSKYLETHAHRVYASGMEAEAFAAKAIVGRIQKGDLNDGFSSRDVWRPQWSNLSDPSQARAGLEMLVEYGWLAEQEQFTGGRPKTAYRTHPSIRTEEVER